MVLPVTIRITIWILPSKLVDLSFLNIFKPSVHSCPSVHQTKDILLLVSRKIAVQGKFGPEVTVGAEAMRPVFRVTWWLIGTGQLLGKPSPGSMA